MLGCHEFGTTKVVRQHRCLARHPCSNVRQQLKQLIRDLLDQPSQHLSRPSPAPSRSRFSRHVLHIHLHNNSVIPLHLSGSYWLVGLVECLSNLAAPSVADMLCLKTTIPIQRPLLRVNECSRENCLMKNNKEKWL